MPDTLAAAWGNLRRKSGPKLAEDGFMGEIATFVCCIYLNGFCDCFSIDDGW